MPLLSNLLVLATIAQAGRIIPRDTTVSKSYTDSSHNQHLGTAGGTTTVNFGVLVWLNGVGTHNFYGNINNDGSIYASQTHWLKTVGFSSGQTSESTISTSTDGIMKNNGTIHLNDIGSLGGPSYDWHLRAMINAGTIQWCGRGNTGGSKYHLYSEMDSINTGLISFEQIKNSFGAGFVWRNTVLSTSSTASNLYNNGAFRLINTVFHSLQNVYGTGCWQIAKGGVLYLEDGSGKLQNPTAGPTFPGQSISFTDSTAVLHMDAGSYSCNSAFGPNIYGFGKGNAIAFSETIRHFSYSTSTGILTVKLTHHNVAHIKLGTGYTASLFTKARKRRHLSIIGHNAILYNGAAPSQSAPAKCSLTAPICRNLGSHPPAAASSSSSFSSVASSTQCSTKSSVQSSTAQSYSRVSSTLTTSTTAQCSTLTTSTTAQSSSATSAAPSSTSTASPSFNYLGCYTEPADSRGINDFPRLIDFQFMTPNLCQAHCSKFNSSLFAVEYGTECYCGNELHCPSFKVAESICNFPCPGNLTEFCGAGNAMNIYGTFPTGNPPTCSSSSFSSIVAVPTTSSSTQIITTASSIRFTIFPSSILASTTSASISISSSVAASKISSAGSSTLTASITTAPVVSTCACISVATVTVAVTQFA